MCMGDSKLEHVDLLESPHMNVLMVPTEVVFLNNWVSDEKCEFHLFPLSIASRD